MAYVIEQDVHATRARISDAPTGNVWAQMWAKMERMLRISRRKDVPSHLSDDLGLTSVAEKADWSRYL